MLWERRNLHLLLDVAQMADKYLSVISHEVSSFLKEVPRNGEYGDKTSVSTHCCVDS